MLTADISRPARRISAASSTLDFKLGRMPLQLVIALSDDRKSGDAMLYRVFDDGLTPVAILTPGKVECSSRFAPRADEQAKLLALFTSALAVLVGTSCA